MIILIHTLQIGLIEIRLDQITEGPAMYRNTLQGLSFYLQLKRRDLNGGDFKERSGKAQTNTYKQINCISNVQEG